MIYASKPKDCGHLNGISCVAYKLHFQVCLISNVWSPPQGELNNNAKIVFKNSMTRPETCLSILIEECIVKGARWFFSSFLSHAAELFLTI